MEHSGPTRAIVREPGIPARRERAIKQAKPPRAEKREHEFKFSPGPLFQIPDLSTVKGVHPEAPETIRLHATYFDTDDLRLSRSGASLRYRNPEGWTVKLPVAKDTGTLTRDELHLEGEPGEPPKPPSTSSSRSFAASR